VENHPAAPGGLLELLGPLAVLEVLATMAETAVAATGKMME
jgi:hypothetical protein